MFRCCFNVNFNVNFKIVFKTIHLYISWWIKKLWPYNHLHIFTNTYTALSVTWGDSTVWCNVGPTPHGSWHQQHRLRQRTIVDLFYCGTFLCSCDKTSRTTTYPVWTENCFIAPTNCSHIRGYSNRNIAVFGAGRGSIDLVATARGSNPDGGGGWGWDLPYPPIPALRPPYLLYNAYMVSYSGEKRLGIGVDNPTPSIAEFVNG